MTRFFRLSGAGNDFLGIADPEEAPDPDSVRALCRRGLSLGADGLFHISRSGTGVDLNHWNADGSLAELCVNGTRCAARLAFHLGWARGEVRISTSAGPVLAKNRGPEEIEIEIEEPGVARVVEIETDSGHWTGWQIRVGVPHLVLAWDQSLEDAPVQSVGPILRSHSAVGPAGANIDFVNFHAPNGLAIRTFERGVENETLACGSGVLASVAVGIAAHGLELPVRCRTRGGYVLEVRDVGGNSPAKRWSLVGDARLLAQGILESGAFSRC